MQIIHLDFETRSACDLLKHGAYNYALDPTTDIVLASYLFHGEKKVHRWRPGDPYPFEGLDIQVRAFNAQFERLIWNFVAADMYGWPEMPIESFYCVSAASQANALPRSLDKVTRALKARYRKDMAGHRLMLKMCKPKTVDPITWFEDPADIDALHDYCDKDVLAEAWVDACIRPMTDYELGIYHRSEHINDYGLRVDLDFARAAVTYADAEKQALAKELVELTDGQITSTRQFAKMKQWLTPRLSPQAMKICEHYVKGEKKMGFDSAIRHNLLAQEEESPGFLTDEVYDFCCIVDEAGKSSISKYQAMIDRNVDEFVCGAYVAFGAMQTGRYASVGVQVHNLVRDVPKNAAEIIDAFKRNARLE